MATKVEVFFDVVSPYTYLFLHALAKLAEAGAHLVDGGDRG